MKLKLTELIEKLGEIRLDLEDAGVDVSEVEVLVGMQPTYPLTGVVLGVISGEELADYIDGELADEARKAVWLATDQVNGYGRISPYAPRPLWEAIS
jgi:hypothetical protein